MPTTQQPIPPAISSAEIEPLHNQLSALVNAAPSADTLVGELVLAENGAAPEEIKVASHVNEALPLATEPVSAREVAHRFETEGVVKQAPRFSDQILDDSRTAPFCYVKPKSTTYKLLTPKHDTGRPKVDGSITEINGLRELHSFLTGFLSYKGDRVRMDRGSKSKSVMQQLVEQSRDMLENLTFIGESELDEAVQGIGAYWKAYLDEDPERKICVMATVNSLSRYRGLKKSDSFIRDRILDTFTDEELEHYSGRIVGGLSGMAGVPRDKGRIILLDDWSISGRQMRETYERLSKHPRFRAFAQAGGVEVNQLVASADRIQNGLPLDPTDESRGSLRMRAYFQAHFAKTAFAAHRSYVTGLHSPVNYGFGDACKDISKKSRGRFRSAPRLARILPNYPDTPAVSISNEKLVRASDPEAVAEDGTSTTDYAVGRLATRVVGAEE